MSFIKKIMDATVNDAEAPPAYFYWSALAAISAVLKNNVVLDKYRYKLHPNIYVMLIGGSGMRKGDPVGMAKKLVSAVDNTRVIAGRGSIQGIISRLANAYTNKAGTIIKDSTGFLVAGEFASFIIQDPAALTILTDLYDSHYHEGEYAISLKSAPEKLNNICITMLAASNEIHFRDAVPKNAVGGGFIARTALVVADKVGKVNSLVNPPTQDFPLADLVSYLKDVAKLQGNFTWSDRGKKLYDRWYQDFMAMSSGRNDSTGTLNRIHDQVLKVAMLISVSNKLDLVLEENDIQEALDVCVNCVVGVKKVTMGVGKSTMAPQTATVLDFLLKQTDNKATRQKILQKFWGELDSYDLDRIAESLMQAGALNAIKNGKHMIYQLTPDTVTAYTQYKQGDDI